LTDRPIDALDRAKGKKVFVRLKNGEEITGVLKALDLHLNLWIEDAEIQGENEKIQYSVDKRRYSSVRFSSIVVRLDLLIIANMLF